MLSGVILKHACNTCLMWGFTMVHVITAENAFDYSDVLEACFRFRHDVFVDELQWHDIAKPDGREKDAYDTHRTIHFAVIREGQVMAYSRLNPSIYPHLLSDVLSDMADLGGVPRFETTFEWSRYGVAAKCRQQRNICREAIEILAGVVEYGQEVGITGFTVECETYWVKKLRMLGFQVSPLGMPKIFNGIPYVAIHMLADDLTLYRMRKVFGIQGSLLEYRASPGLPDTLHRRAA